MTQKKLETFQMETKFDGLIKLLAEALYPEPDVFVRELVQNGHDSIVRRMEKEPNLAGRIDVECDRRARIITFTDNGIGMDKRDIRQFLSTIGSSGTDFARKADPSRALDVIGQFGIGMLSAFVVADKVYVETRKAGSEEAFEWRNFGSADCELYASDRREAGSRITVFLRDDFSYFLTDAKLREIIVRYCDFISVPVYVNGVRANTVTPPWKETYSSEEARQAAYSTFIDRRFTDGALDVFPVEINGDYHAEGILYISDRRVAGINTGGQLDVFIHRMLVKRADSSLLPEWAMFVRGVIESPDLNPTLARDNLQKSDSFRYIREQLGVKIIEHLTDLANENPPKRFRVINEWHHYYLKGMAYFYDTFFDAVADRLLFETNRGMMSLRDYCAQTAKLADGHTPLYFFSYTDSAPQYYRMANEKHLIVINTGLRFDEEVLKKYAEKNSAAVVLKQFDVLTDGALFEPLSPQEAGRYVELEQEFTFALNRQGLNVEVETKSFLPKVIPAVIVDTERTKSEEAFRAMMDDPRVKANVADTWSEVVKDQRRRRRKLVLNAGNPVIEGMADIRDHLFLGGMIITAYNNAMVYSHRMREEDMDKVHDSVTGLMGETLDLYREWNAARARLAELETPPEQTDEEVPADAAPEKPLPYTQVFMITPYRDEHLPVIAAVRNILEGPPFFFRVLLAKDRVLKGGRVVSDTIRHMNMSHAFVADITGENPNVMMELGAILMREDDRPVLVLSGDPEAGTIADMGDKLFVRYGSLKEDRPEAIEARIKEELMAEGRVRREDWDELKNRRTGCYLSRTVLNSVSIRLDRGQISELLGQYDTMEELLAADSGQLAERLGLSVSKVNVLKEDLEGMMKNA